MAFSRRDFLSTAVVGTVSLGLEGKDLGGEDRKKPDASKADAAVAAGKRPIIVSAGNGFDYLDDAFAFLKNGGDTLDAALKAKVEMPGMIGGGMSPGGCADASLYQRFHALGLKELSCFPQLVAVRPGSPRLARYQQQILAALSPAETEAWRRAAAQAERDGTYFVAQPFHCAVGTKPA